MEEAIPTGLVGCDSSESATSLWSSSELRSERSVRGIRGKAGSQVGFGVDVPNGCCWTRPELDEVCGLHFASFLNNIRNSSFGCISFNMVVLNKEAVEHEAVYGPDVTVL